MPAMLAAATDPLALYVAMGVIGCWLAIGALGLAVPHHLDFVGHVLFPASAVVSASGRLEERWVSDRDRASW